MIKKIWKIIKFYGIWTIPVSIGSGYYLIELILKIELTVKGWWLLFLLSFLICFFIYCDNWTRRKNGKDEDDIRITDALDSLSSYGKVDEFTYSDGREKYMYPKVADELLVEKDEANGYIFGQAIGDSKHFVCKQFDECDGSSTIIVGGAGSGKTQISLNFAANCCKDDSVHVLLVDPKGEFTHKVYSDGDNTILFNPKRRSSRFYGYDPFWNICNEGPEDEQSTEQEVYSAMKIISNSLIPSGSGESAFWKSSARNLLTGLLVYFYYHKKLKTLPEIVMKIKEKPIADVIADVVADAPSSSKAYMLTISYHGLANETLTSIDSNLSIAISDYANDDDIVWILQCARKKFTPETLLESNVFMNIDLVEMTKLTSVVLLIVNQFIAWTLTLPDNSMCPDRKPIILMIEEMTAFLAAIATATGSGRIDQLGQGLRFSRSKGVSFIAICQSLSAIRFAYGGDNNEVEDILTNFQYKLFLQANDPDTQEWLSKACGVYPKKSVSYNGEGGKRTRSISFSEASIVRPQDLISLPSTAEAILLSPFGYNRIRKVYAYKNKYLKHKLNI